MKRDANAALPIDDAATMLSALSDPTRLRLVSLILHNGEICVCDLMEITGLPQTKISKHLSVLRHAGMVNQRREGTWMHYSMSESENGLQTSLIDSVRDAYKTVPALNNDLKKLKTSDCCSPSAKPIQIKI